MSDPQHDYRGWYNAGRLPHFDAPGTIQFITFRLADSIPINLLREWKKEVTRFPDDAQSDALRARIETYLDRGYGSCVLGHPAMAATLQNTFEYYNGKRYQLLDWVIMPNHVHVLIRPDYSLPRIVQAWKTYSARWAIQNAGKLDLKLPTATFWMRGYWDRYIRNEDHLMAAIHYIQQNPVKAGLCQKAEDWEWSSSWPGEET